MLELNSSIKLMIYRLKRMLKNEFYCAVYRKVILRWYNGLIIKQEPLSFFLV
jgi:hypothetical protein